MNDVQFIVRDISACLLALANALEAKGVLTKAELAQAAQERFLVLQSLLPGVDTDSLPMLHAMATLLERKPGD